VLDEDDHAMLRERGYVCEVTVDEGGWTNLVIKDYTLPAGFDHEKVDLLLRLNPAFPDVKPDMYYVEPTIRLAATQGFAPASELHEPYLDRTWQRFSRHLADGQWRPGIDNLGTWLTMIRQQFEKDVA
jgi:Prokaryotic E2 family E